MPTKLIESKLLASLPGLRHGFRVYPRIGASEPGDTLEPRVATVKQVHKDVLVWTTQPEKRAREADAIATLEPHLPVGVYSADCAPVLVAALDSHGAPLGVMAVHAGWRGTALEITAKSFFDFHGRLAGQGPLRFVAVIGPCISFESFEVGAEVVEAFPGSLERGLARPLRQESGNQKYLFDLPGENARQLRDAANQVVASLELEVLPICTLKEHDSLPSYRRDRENAGRILSYLEFQR